MMSSRWWWVGCCHICPRDCCPRRPWSKGTNVQGTVVQGDFCPRKLLPVISLLKLFFYSLLDITILIDDKMTKKNYMNSP